MYKLDGNAIRIRRAELHMTQAELAQMAKVSVMTVVDMETGRRSGFSTDTLFAVAEALQTTPGFLFTTDGGEECIQSEN